MLGETGTCATIPPPPHTHKHTLVRAVTHLSAVLSAAPTAVLRLQGFQQWSLSSHEYYYR